MNKEKLEFILQEGESDKVEFKPSLSQMDEIVQAAAGFANLRGGTIFIGISNRAGLLGCNIGRGSIENLANIINQSTEPKIHPEISIENIEDKKIIVINVSESIDKPVLAFGKLYKRIGKSTVLCSRNEFEKLVLEKHKENMMFDSQICREAKLKDIDKSKVKRFRELYEDINKNSIKSSDNDLLKSLNCLKEIDGKIKVTNAGILLFGKKPDEFYPVNYITIARYPDIEKGQEYSDIKDFYGDLFEIVDSANSYIKEHIQEVSKVIEGKLAREVIPQYSYFAIRELITNAVVHRDYNIKGSRIIIRMFRDRIEFSSPGKFPANITPKNIVYEQYSRNPIIADVFSKVKYIEEMGEGWDKIMDSIKKHPLKPKLPEIVDTGNTVVVTLFSPKEMAGDSEKTALQATLKTTLKTTLKNDEKILELVKLNRKFTKEELARELNISLDGVKYHIKNLETKKRIKWVGPSKGGHWEITKR